MVLLVLSYTINMNTQTTLTIVRDYCISNSGDPQTWENKGTTYQWNIGRSTATGVVNGVVRKLAGIDASGTQIWVVAGSLKLNPDGTIARWTGMPRETQKTFENTRLKVTV